ncbi:thioredoxin family protein [Crateriforma conspicua]|uniref:Thioredoxin n=1 Tax=Crateriforma conspicua TaxID=2527996 RepID=A0A5C5Y629_9PLAN|nr:thioredoxin family protein [Crateriforma conspicua]QDV64292.1 Thioredoxin [Crateriforma conspicua]TWT69685.1 Thioredoxin [Crateriforma conspicua]
MFLLLFAAAVTTASHVETLPSDYNLAYKQSVAEHKPLMVMVGAPWCPACNVMKDTTLKSIEQSGELSQVSFAVVDRDAQPELAEQLLKGEKMIPRLIVFTKIDGAWKREELKGYQPTQPVRSLIRRAVSRVHHN